jgi:hypothetical protein
MDFDMDFDRIAECALFPDKIGASVSRVERILFRRKPVMRIRTHLWLDFEGYGPLAGSPRYDCRPGRARLKGANLAGKT